MLYMAQVFIDLLKKNVDIFGEWNLSLGVVNIGVRAFFLQFFSHILCVRVLIDVR